MTTTEILNAIEAEIGDTDNATHRPRLLTRLDRAHKVLITGGGELNTTASGRQKQAPTIFPWAVDANPTILNLEVKIDDIIDASSLTNTFTITTDAGTKDLTGWYLQMNLHDTVYRITSHTTTTVVLDSAILLVGTATEAIKIFKLDYDVTCTIPLDDFDLYTKDAKYTCGVLAPREFADVYSKNATCEAIPRSACIVKQVGSTFTFRFNSYPDEAVRAEIIVIPTITSLDEAGEDPILPEHFQELLVHFTTFYDLRLNEDDRAGSYFQSAKNMFDALSTEARQILHFNDKLYGDISPVGSNRKKTRSITDL